MATTFLGTGQIIRTLFLGIKIGAVAEETRAKHGRSPSWQRQRACYDARLRHVSVAATRVDFLTFHKIKGRGVSLCCWAWALDSDATAEALCDPQRMPAESILPRKPLSQGPDPHSCCENLGAHLGANQTRKSVGPLIVTKFN